MNCEVERNIIKRLMESNLLIVVGRMNYFFIFFVKINIKLLYNK